MQAYLDNSATTRCSEGVRDIVVKVMMEDFGNPSSRHDKGMEAEKYLREARMDIAATLKADEKGKQQLLDVLVGLHGFLALVLLWLL